MHCAAEGDTFIDYASGAYCRNIANSAPDFGHWLIISFVVLVILPVNVPAFRYSPVLATILVTKYLFWMLLGHALGHLFVYPHDPSGNYYAVRRAGWHPFWDRLWPIFNPDSELIRDGGFEEPEYTDFIPPPEWVFQCPVCGARQPYQVCVCWIAGMEPMVTRWRITSGGVMLISRDNH